MIKVIIGSNTSREEDMFADNATLREALEAHNIDTSVGSLHLDGVTLKIGELDKSFEELGITNKCSLIQVVKGDAAF